MLDKHVVSAKHSLQDQVDSILSQEKGPKLLKSLFLAAFSPHLCSNEREIYPLPVTLF